MKDTSKIPLGDYCYDIISVDNHTGRIKTKLCPYWSANPDKRDQENGHCSYLGFGDWETDFLTHLWDQVKECRINMLEDVGFDEPIDVNWGK